MIMKKMLRKVEYYNRIFGRFFVSTHTYISNCKYISNITTTTHSCKYTYITVLTIVPLLVIFWFHPPNSTLLFCICLNTYYIRAQFICNTRMYNSQQTLSTIYTLCEDTCLQDMFLRISNLRQLFFIFSPLKKFMLCLSTSHVII